MRVFVCFLICMSINFNVMGQDYSGKVIDSNNEVIAYANVTAHSVKDSTFLKGTITDDNGNFVINLDSKGQVYLEISYIGFETKRIVPETDNDLGNIILESQNEELDEVVITGRKKLIQHKVDRMVFNISSSAAGSGGDALEALKITPGVQVGSDQLNIVGKNQVMVMIDDRMVQLSGSELMDYLASLSSDDIQSIEVITTPPSKYDAEGNSGLINIRLKESQKDSWNNNARMGYTQTSYPAMTLGNTYSYSSGKVQLMTSINGKIGNEGQLLTIDLDYPDGPWKGEFPSKKQQDFVSTRLGFDYTVNQKASIGLIYSGTVSDYDEMEDGLTSIFDTNGSQTGKIDNMGFNDRNGNNNSLNLHYIQKLDTVGKKLSIDLDYFSLRDSQNRNFNSNRTGNVNYSVKADNNSKQDIDNYSAKADMEHPISWGNLSYGAKATATRTDNSVDYYDLAKGTPVRDSSQSDQFEYSENIFALYLDWTKALGQKWQAKAGLRAEKTLTLGTSQSYEQEIERDYLNLFPTVYFSYSASENSVLNFSYSRRIKRPGFSELNPFRFYLNANSYLEGNPFLQPELSDNLEFKYIYKGILVSKLFSNFSYDSFGQIPYVDPATNQQIVTRDNYYNSRTVGIEETLSYNPFLWWNSVSQITIYNLTGQFKEDFDLGTEILSGWNFYANSNNTFFFNSQKTVQADLTLTYFAPQRILLAQTTTSFSLDLGLKMLFLDNKLACSFSIFDIFKSSAPDFIASTNGIKQTYNSYFDNRYFKIGLSYKFGNDKIKLEERKFGNEQEKQRTN